MELKIGQSARVWEVIKPVWLFEDVLKVSSHYIEDVELSHENAPYLIPFDGEKDGVAYAFYDEVKLVGKLTITKLK